MDERRNLLIIGASMLFFVILTLAIFLYLVFDGTIPQELYSPIATSTLVLVTAISVVLNLALIQEQTYRYNIK